MEPSSQLAVESGMGWRRFLNTVMAAAVAGTLGTGNSVSFAQAPSPEASESRQRIRRQETAIIEQCGHVLQRECPDATAREYLAFLAAP